MKKIIVIFLFSFLIPTHFALASWWNPGTWFTREKTSQLEELRENPEENLKVDRSKQKTDVEATSESPIQTNDLQSELRITRKEIQNKDKEITSLKKALAELQKNLASANPQCKPAIVEKIVYQDRMVERPVEKLVYRDRVVQASCNTPTTSTQTTPAQTSYSDYNFNPRWTQDNGVNTLSCTPTSRSIGTRKAVFKILDGEIERLAELQSFFESDDWKYTQNLSFFANGMNNITLEKKDENTFQYVGGNIPINCSNPVPLRFSMCGGISEVANQGRNMGVYLASKGIEVGDMCAQMVLTEWEVLDHTTSKPVKTN